MLEENPRMKTGDYRVLSGRPDPYGDERNQTRVPVAARVPACGLEVSTVNAVSPKRSGHPGLRTLGVGLAGLLSVYLIGRGIAEFLTVNYSDPASCRNDWGGPSLAGVFAVHSGPAVLVVVGWAICLRRRRRTRSGERR